MMIKRLLLILLVFICNSLFSHYDASAQVIEEKPPDATIVFNPTGTHIRDGVVKVRFDIYFGEGSSTYKDQYVDKPVFPYVMSSGEEANHEIDVLKYDAWWKSVLKHKELNPALCVFVPIDRYTTVAEITEYIEQIFNVNNLKALDDAMVLSDSAHRASSFISGIPKLQYSLVDEKHTAIIITEVNNKFINLQVASGISEEEPPITPRSIDIGPGATDLDNITAAFYTVVDMANPANATGTINTFEIWANTQLTGCEAATFFVVAGNNLSTNDFEVIGVVVSGSKQTFAGLDMDVTIGEYLGVWWTIGIMERSAIAGAGYWYAAGDQIPCVNQLFLTAAPRAISIYGTGVEPTPPTPPAPPPPPWPTGEPPAGVTIATTTQLVVSMMLMAVFSTLAFWGTTAWKENAITFMLAGGASLMTGLFWYDINTTNIGLSISLLLIAYSLLCLGLAFRCIFWREDILE